MKLYFIPFFVLGGIVSSLVLTFLFQSPFLASLSLLIVIFIGSLDLIKDTVRSFIHKKFVLDYIALLSITVAVATGEYLVAAVIVLMLSGGHTLEKVAVTRAKQSLTKLTNRIPHEVILWEKGITGATVAIETIAAGAEIFVRKGEVIPLDGILLSDEGQADESSLTGEPYVIDKIKGDAVRSGTVNIGESMVVRVTRPEKDSTYRKIITMVEKAQAERSPLIRLADRYSGIFTLVTLAVAAFAYAISGDITRVLAVFVIATPCPLILATPIALIGGVNAYAKRKIIAKRLSAIEVISRVSAIIFDKTGTITLGRPALVDVIIFDKKYTRSRICAVAAAIERNSLHPIAKAITHEAKKSHAAAKIATDVTETIGRGIRGKVDGTSYRLEKIPDEGGLSIGLFHNATRIATFLFEDEIKGESPRILRRLKKMGLRLFIFTGDKKESAEKITGKLDLPIVVRAGMTPEEKMQGIEDIRRDGTVAAMVGDGINDAPALAASSVGMVFSNEEQTAASEAADIVFLGGNVSQVLESLLISRRTIRIALESIWKILDWTCK